VIHQSPIFFSKVQITEEERRKLLLSVSEERFIIQLAVRQP